MKKIVIGLAAAGLVLSTGAFASDFKMGVVDVHKVFLSVPQGQTKLDAMKAELKPEIADLEKKHTELMTEAQETAKSVKAMSASEKTAAEHKLAEKEKTFETSLTQLRTKEMKKEAAAAHTFQTDFKNAVDEVAQKDHYDLIEPTQAVLYYNPSNVSDTTSEVAAAMKKAAQHS